MSIEDGAYEVEISSGGFLIDLLRFGVRLTPEGTSQRPMPAFTINPGSIAVARSDGYGF